MREPVRDQGRLRHILGAIDNVLEFMEGKTTADLRQDRILFYAVVKNIEIIGEAAYMLSEEFKASHPGTFSCARLLSGQRRGSLGSITQRPAAP
jgi:uncharacterized protein with HEPN domain